ncbi:MAG: TonB-dependent receptor [Bacteroidia bacterium]|nr:TonB-dependent receptor [Bacteroidia bacterium]
MTLYSRLAGLLFCLLPTALAAQNGLLTGQVSDAKSGQPLAGATLSIPGAGIGAATDLNGRFVLPVKAGEVTLLVRYIGYADTTLRIPVAAGSSQQLDIALSSRTYELSGVVITGQLQGQARALNQQRAADHIKNIVAADQIGRFPDPNAAEALQRVPGVNIERDQGEGRYVLVRGLAPQFTNISVNGEQIPSPEADVRYVALDAIPADQLASMEVSKALTPDMDGDAIGGSVNLITRTAQGGDPQLSASLAGGYNALMNRPNLQGSLMAARRFGARERFGALVNVSQYHNALGSDNWEREPFDNEVELRDYELTRTRFGLSATFDYRFNPRNEVYVRALSTRFTDREWRRRYVFIPEDEEIERLTKDRFEAQSVQSVNAGGRHLFPHLQLDYEVQYAYGEQDTPYDIEGAFIAGLPSSLGFSSREFPAIDAPGYLDNSEYEFDSFEAGSTLAQDQNLTAKVNIGLPYSLGGRPGLLKFGGKVRLKDKSYRIRQEVYESTGGVPNLDEFEGGLLDTRFLGGQYELAPPLDIGRLMTYFNGNPQQFELQIEDKAIDEALESYEASEDVYAGYLMARQQLDKLMILGGARYEFTRTQYLSSDVVIAPNGDLQEIRPVSGGRDYAFLLPQLHLRYAVNPSTNLRAAATFTYARPNFSEIVPSQEANFEDEEATVGNPELRPVGAFNLDLLGEHYYGNVGLLSGGVFFKRLDGFIYNRISFDSQYPLTGTPIATGIDVTQAQNGNQARLLGAEIAFQRSLSFLPGFWSGFGLYANYTYTYSSAAIQSREADEDNPDLEEMLRLPGQATHVGNISLAYERKGFSARLSANFNGSYLSEIGASAEEDIYVADRLQLDLNLSYALSERFRVFGEFLNLTNQPFEVYQGQPETRIQREFYAWWSRFGVKFDF